MIFLGGAAVVTSCGMVPDSVRDTRSFDFPGLPRHAPETSGKECLLGPFWDLFRTLPRPCLGAVWYYVVYPGTRRAQKWAKWRL